ncbi:MAG: 23S rRNA (adenine(2503)-C(2))-methyltransferase RlmN, partial [Vampirovibrionales bacterium]|nr:23S rRNA (adenine(2503)-C(2))-methyltransferase RlmN [Vampirovibrionales bacterium]
PPTPSLVGHSHEALYSLMQTLEEPKFRADQIHHWMYVKGVRTYEAMSNLAKSTRLKLAERFPSIGCLTLKTREISQDGTQKFLFRLADGKVVESVLMPYQERGTVSACISSQVGCAVNCSFCATAKLGFTRQLSVSEIVDQYLYVQHLAGVEVRNIVFMGQGEPLLNLENLLPAITLLNQSAEVGMRRMTISTAGVVPGILRLAEESFPLTLAVSLHAPDDETRSSIMPINKKWPIAELIPSLHHYSHQTGRRLTIEYILIQDVNDSASQAHQLAQLLKGLKCNVNLIPYNPIAPVLLPIEGANLKRSTPQAIHQFQQIVSSYGRKVTIRLERGVDINAACGQLANQHQ